MSEMRLAYPKIVEYSDALFDSEAVFRRKKLQRAKFAENGFSRIHSSGSFACVAKAHFDSRWWALRLLLVDQPGLVDRYSAIDRLASEMSEVMLSTQTFDSEIQVPGYPQGRLPVFAIEWFEGETLGNAVLDACAVSDTKLLANLRSELELLASQLYRKSIAHGDISADNIMVAGTSDKPVLKLVDYDSMWSPEKELCTVTDAVGIGPLQHLQRTPVLGRYADVAPFMIMFLALELLSRKPELAKEGDFDSGYFLVSASEVLSGSSLFHEHSGIINKGLLRQLEEFLNAPYGDDFPVPWRGDEDSPISSMPTAISTMDVEQFCFEHGMSVTDVLMVCNRLWPGVKRLNSELSATDQDALLHHLSSGTPPPLLPSEPAAPEPGQPADGVSIEQVGWTTATPIDRVITQAKGMFSTLPIDKDYVLTKNQADRLMEKLRHGARPSGVPVYALAQQLGVGTDEVLRHLRKAFSTENFSRNSVIDSERVVLVREALRKAEELKRSNPSRRSGKSLSSFAREERVQIETVVALAKRTWPSANWSADTIIESDQAAKLRNALAARKSAWSSPDRKSLSDVASELSLPLKDVVDAAKKVDSLRTWIGSSTVDDATYKNIRRVLETKGSQPRAVVAPQVHETLMGDDDRISRSDFWHAAPALVLCVVAARWLAVSTEGVSGVPIVLNLVSVAVSLVLWLSVVWRLHDVGKPGWWSLAALIPVPGLFVLVYLLLKPSQPGENQWGRTMEL